MLRVKGALDENGIPVEVSIDKQLYTDLIRAKERLKGNWDNVFILSALPGMGKSQMGITTMAPVLANKMSDIFITFDVDDFIETCSGPKTKAGDVVILDEGYEGMNTGRVSQTEFRRMVNLLMLVRQKRLHIIIITQNFFDLAKSVAIFRSNLLYHITTNKKGKRGTYLVWDRVGKKRLYIMGKKYLNYSIVPANARGQFNKNEHLLPKDYLKRKFKHLLDQNKRLKEGGTLKRMDVAKKLMDNTILNLIRLHFKQKDIAKIMGIALKTLTDHCAKMKTRKLVPEAYLDLNKTRNKLPIMPSELP